MKITDRDEFRQLFYDFRRFAIDVNHFALNIYFVFRKYSNETFRGGEYICVNGESEYVGEFIDGYGLAEEDYDCVVIDGKHRWEIDEEDDLDEIEKEIMEERGLI